MVIPHQFSHGKLEPLQCFSPVKNTGFPDSLRSNNNWPAGSIITDHSQLRSFSPLRFPYSLLAFCRDFQLFGSSQENSHKCAKVPRSGVVFNLEKKGDNLSEALQKLQKHPNLIVWQANNKKNQMFIFF